MNAINKHRLRNLELDRSETKKNMNALQHSPRWYKNRTAVDGTAVADEDSSVDSGYWSWAWVLDGHERPPPSSIASRRDTAEARRLAKIADECVFPNDKTLSGNNFWSLAVNFFTATPDRDKLDLHSDEGQGSKFSRFLRRGSPPLKEGRLDK
jgi:hypothetical protein